MPYDLGPKLVVAIASSALFDLRESDRIFRENGEAAYRQHQRDNEHVVLQQGVAFPFIRRLLALNPLLECEPVEVILISRNDADTGLRVMNSIRAHGLNISRSAFMGGADPYPYLPAYGSSLFLSANADDVKGAIMAGHAAGRVMDSTIEDNSDDLELRVAFDFDGVIANDEAERVFHAGGLEKFHASEDEKSDVVMEPGPLKELLTKIAQLQQLELAKKTKDPKYKPLISIAIITARNSPADKRMILTLRAWGIIVDKMFNLGGVDKAKILAVYKPHIFFDDQQVHLDTACGIVPSVHIPFGIRNETTAK